MVQQSIIRKIIAKDVTAFGEFEYNYGLLLGIKVFGNKNTNLYRRIMQLEHLSKQRANINLEIELRKAVLDHYLN